MFIRRDEVEFRWAGNKLFLPGTANNTVGEVYNLYQTGEMALYYQPEAHIKKAAGARPQFEMALEIYIDKPAVSKLLILLFYMYSQCFLVCP